jgi:hypothetical protein
MLEGTEFIAITRYSPQSDPWRLLSSLRVAPFEPSFYKVKRINPPGFGFTVSFEQVPEANWGAEVESLVEASMRSEVVSNGGEELEASFSPIAALLDFFRFSCPVLSSPQWFRRGQSTRNV